MRGGTLFSVCLSPSRRKGDWQCGIAFILMFVTTTDKNSDGSRSNFGGCDTFRSSYSTVSYPSFSQGPPPPIHTQSPPLPTPLIVIFSIESKTKLKIITGYSGSGNSTETEGSDRHLSLSFHIHRNRLSHCFREGGLSISSRLSLFVCAFYVCALRQNLFTK